VFGLPRHVEIYLQPVLRTGAEGGPPLYENSVEKRFAPPKAATRD
jgi:hypothetical protein